MHHVCLCCQCANVYIYIYIYIKWTVFVNVTTKSAQHARARMIAIIVEKSPNSSHMYDHGFMDNTNRQAVNCKFTKWLPPWRKGRISCLWIKSVFDCLTIGIIHETMVVHMTWVWTFFNNYIYIYMYICIYIHIYILPLPWQIWWSLLYHDRFEIKCILWFILPQHCSFHIYKWAKVRCWKPSICGNYLKHLKYVVLHKVSFRLLIAKQW